MSDKVLVTGANSYLGGHVIQLLLERGHSVVGTLRSANDKALLEKAFQTYGDRLTLELAGDIVEPTVYDQVFANHTITSVIHTAIVYAPAQYDPKDLDRVLYEPAVTSQLNVLRKAQAAGTVRTVVLTSSYSVMAPAMPDRVPVSGPITEESWTPISAKDAAAASHPLMSRLLSYAVSKKLAEQAAWDFMDQVKPQFTLTTIRAPYIFGAYAVKTKPIAQMVPMMRVLGSCLDIDPAQPPAIVDCGSSFWVHVKDFALAHVRAIEIQDGRNHKWATMQGGPFSLQVLLKEAKKVLPRHYAERIMDTDDAAYAHMLENAPPLDVSKTAAETGIQYHTLADTAAETMRFLIEAKVLEESQRARQQK